MSPQPKTVFAEPPKRIRGAYECYEYAPAGSFGPREAGSTLSAVAMLQPIMLATSYEIEALASQSGYGLPTGVAFGSSWLAQTAATVALKVIANILRNYGAGIVRDLGAWLWGQFVMALARSMWDGIKSLWPFGRRRVPRPFPGPTPDGGDRWRPGRRLIDILFPRRRNRR